MFTWSIDFSCKDATRCRNSNNSLFSSICWRFSASNFALSTISKKLTSSSSNPRIKFSMNQKWRQKIKFKFDSMKQKQKIKFNLGNLLSLWASSNSKSFLSRCSLRRSNNERASYGSSGRSICYKLKNFNLFTIWIF